MPDAEHSRIFFRLCLGYGFTAWNGLAGYVRAAHAQAALDRTAPPECPCNGRAFGPCPSGGGYPGGTGRCDTGSGAERARAAYRHPRARAWTGPCKAWKAVLWTRSLALRLHVVSGWVRSVKLHLSAQSLQAYRLGPWSSSFLPFGFSSNASGLWASCLDTADRPDLSIPATTEEAFATLAPDMDHTPRAFHFYTDGPKATDGAIGSGVLLLIESDHGWHHGGCLYKPFLAGTTSASGEHGALKRALFWAVQLSTQHWSMHGHSLVSFAFHFDAMNSGLLATGYWRTTFEPEWRSLQRGLAQLLQARHCLEALN